MRIIWGFSYSIFRLSYQLKVFSYNPKNFGKYVGYCLSVQRFGSLIAVTLGVYLTVKLGYFNLLLLLSLLVIPAFILVSRIKEINIDKISKPKINWNLFYFDHQFLLRKNILLLSFFKFSSSFTSNGLAIATITPFLISINQGSMSTELILTIAGLIVGFRWIADIIFGVLFGGNKILYVSDSSGNNEIYIHEIRNKKNSRLTNNEVDEKNISWSERNKSIIFTSNAHGRADIYKMKGDGSNQEIIKSLAYLQKNQAPT